MFTLAHELAHVFVCTTGVSNVEATPLPGHDAERFCNNAAAEFLVSEEELTVRWRRVGIEDSLQAVARRFRVSVLVAAHRALRLRLIDRNEFGQFYDAYQQQAARRPDETTGGSFWNSQNVRIGRRFRGGRESRREGGPPVVSRGVCPHGPARQHVRHVRALIGSDEVKVGVCPALHECRAGKAHDLLNFLIAKLPDRRGRPVPAHVNQPFSDSTSRASSICRRENRFFLSFHA